MKSLRLNLWFHSRCLNPRSIANEITNWISMTFNYPIEDSSWLDTGVDAFVQVCKYQGIPESTSHLSVHNRAPGSTVRDDIVSSLVISDKMIYSMAYRKFDSKNSDWFCKANLQYLIPSINSKYYHLMQKNQIAFRGNYLPTPLLTYLCISRTNFLLYDMNITRNMGSAIISSNSMRIVLLFGSPPV